MSTIDPAKVREARDQPHHVFDWTVPGSVGGEPLAIRGSLDYKPPPEEQLQPDPDRTRRRARARRRHLLVGPSPALDRPCERAGREVPSAGSDGHRLFMRTSAGPDSHANTTMPALADPCASPLAHERPLNAQLRRAEGSAVCA